MELFAVLETKRSGIALLDKGTHRFTLNSSASLKANASPDTPPPITRAFNTTLTLAVKRS
ncbi:hypothetical protein BDV18DRAFT_141547 [Aspergillus unguis]